MPPDIATNSSANAADPRYRLLMLPLSLGVLRIIPGDLLEMEEFQVNRHFQMSKAISTDIRAGPTRPLDVARALLAYLPDLDAPLAAGYQPFEPPPSFAVARRVDYPQRGSAYAEANLVLISIAG
jgi:hypothetical protein